MNYRKEIEKVIKKYKLLKKQVHPKLGVPETVVYGILRFGREHVNKMEKREEGRRNLSILDKRIPELLEMK
jgi:hypothetical protein